MTAAGFPHSGIAGSTLTCSSPTLIAAYRALLRLSVPRHPPCALLSLDRIVFCPTPAPNEEGLSSPPNQHTCLVLSSFASSKIFTIRSASLPNPITLVFKNSCAAISPRAI